MTELEREWFSLDMETIVLWNAGSSIPDIARLTNRSENACYRTLAAYGRGGRNPRTRERAVNYVRGLYEPEGVKSAPQGAETRADVQ